MNYTINEVSNQLINPADHDHLSFFYKFELKPKEEFASIIDIDDVTDQSMFSKDLTKMFYSPMDTLTQAIYPSSAEYAEAIYKALK